MSMGELQIKQLPNDLINQIAAGEVVERPASALKELMENALDARSQRIDISLFDGGMKKIEILDNGVGMVTGDLERCVDRYTTSKISQASDLETISSYGFRGEALSSIASVATVTVRSRTKDTDYASRLKVSFGEKGVIEKCGGPVGTLVSVEELFQRTPARSKFLRSINTEFAHCSRVVRELAMANPEVTFLFSHQEKSVKRWEKSDRKNRAEEVLGGESALVLVEESDGTRLEAYLIPAHHTQDRGELLIFVNCRSIKNRLLYSAVRSAYQETLGNHHSPSGTLYIDIRPDWVDVNVHPQKLEVRLLRQERLYQWIRAIIRKGISHTSTSTLLREWKGETYQIPSVSHSFVRESTNSDMREKFMTEERLPVFSSVSEPSHPYEERIDGELPSDLFYKRASFRFLSQIKASYLVCEDAKGLLLVDQHALHEKLEFERLMNKFRFGEPSVQALLVGKVVHLPADLFPVWEEHKTTLSEIGFETLSFGENDICVKSRPNDLPEGAIEEVIIKCLRDLLGDRSAGGKTELEPLIRPVLATVACHSVVRANQVLSDREASQLLEGLDSIKEGWTCPHGRPILFRLSFESISKHFER